MKRFIFVFSFLAIFLFAISSPRASEAIESESIRAIYAKTKSEALKYEPSEVLVVIDIDNTVLVPIQTVGSDQWFTWQMKNLERDFSGKVSNSFSKLLRVNEVIQAITKMRLTEEVFPKTLDQWKERGFKIISLSSRSPVFLSTSLRQFEENGIFLKDAAIGPLGGFGGRYLPYSPNTPSESGLTEEEVQKHGKKEPRLVVFQEGLYLTAGQHKGLMLKALLHKTGFTPKLIAFVDDHSKHTQGIQKIFQNSGIEVLTFRYSKEDKNVARFHESDKKQAIETWKSLKAPLNAGFHFFE